MKSLFPEIQINVRVVSANTSMEILKRGEADIAFWEGTEPQGAFRTIPLGVYKLYAACVTGYPLPENLLADSLRKKSLRLIEAEGLPIENRMLAVFHKDKYLTRPMQVMLENIIRSTP